MTGSLVGRIVNGVRLAPELYHRLVLLVGPVGTGKTQALRAAMTELDGKYVNLSLELSRRLLDVADGQRPRRVAQLLKDALGEETDRTLLLDNIELLFEASLQQDPLRLLQRLSRNQVVVVAWPGTVQDGTLNYGLPGHPEHRRYPAGDLLIVRTSGSGKPS